MELEYVISPLKKPSEPNTIISQLFYLLFCIEYYNRLIYVRKNRDLLISIRLLYVDYVDGDKDVINILKFN